MIKKTPEIMLAEEVSNFVYDPLGFVLFVFSWGEGILKNKKPNEFQVKFLTRLGEEVAKRKFDGSNPVAPIRMAVASGHGVGKSTLTAWIILWLMATRSHCKGIVTANTSDQLKTKTWSELAKWLNLSCIKHWFDYSSGKGSMSLKQRLNPETWRVDAQTCREENSESFAGLHASDSTPFYIFDEASAVPDAIYDVAQGGLTDGEPIMLLFGNPTRNTGFFRECWRQNQKRWIVFNIDSRDVEGTNKHLLNEWIDDYGVDSDFCKIRILGQFPNQSALQFFSEKLVEGACGVALEHSKYKFAPVVIGVDPAWEGDDKTVIWLRQGLYSECLAVIEKNDNDLDIAQRVARLQDERGAVAVNVDAGYGTGIVSAARTMRRNWSLIWFSGKSSDLGCINKRAEMFKDVKDWLRQGGCIPKDSHLIEELNAIETIPTLDGKLQFEQKKQFKKRIGRSPDRLDALALTFATHITAVDCDVITVNSDYQPF